jgi:hypothetical protein
MHGMPSCVYKVDTSYAVVAEVSTSEKHAIKKYDGKVKAHYPEGISECPY